MSATSKTFSGAVTVWSLVGLVAGLGLGVVGYQTGHPGVHWLARTMEPLGILWLNAIQMTVVPLVVTQLLAALVRAEEDSWLGDTGWRTVSVFAVMMVGSGVLALILTPMVMQFFTVAPETIAAVKESVLIPDTARMVGERSPASFGSWLVALVPTNIFQAATGGEILPILVFTLLFGLAANQLPIEQRKPLSQMFQALADTLLTIIRWILWGMPVGIFALLIVLGLGTGIDAAGLLGLYLLVACSMRLLYVGGLYPISALFGRTSIQGFARAAAPAQLVGFSTRSSLASLPAQIEGGRRHLNFPESTTAFVLPLAVSVFRVSGPMGSSLKMMFLAHVFGVGVTVGSMATFLITILLLNFTTAGVPRTGGTFRSLPAYLAAGIPIEGYIVLSAVGTLTDFFTTLLNVTGQVSAGTILSGGAREGQRSPGAMPVRPAVAS